MPGDALRKDTLAIALLPLVLEEAIGQLQVCTPPPSRTNRTRRVPHPVLIGHAASLTPY